MVLLCAVSGMHHTPVQVSGQQRRLQLVVLQLQTLSEQPDIPAQVGLYWQQLLGTRSVPFLATEKDQNVNELLMQNRKKHLSSLKAIIAAHLSSH